MSVKWILAGGVALMVGLAGVALWLDRPAPDSTQSRNPLASSEALGKVDATAGAIYAARFTDSNGKEHVLGEWQHKLLLINFWATWCGPCKEEMPMLAKMQEKHAANGLQIVGIAADSAANVANYAGSVLPAYPWLPDEAGAMEFSKRLGNRLGLLPFTIVLKPGGEVIYTRLGVISEAELTDLVAKHTVK